MPSKTYVNGTYLQKVKSKKTFFLLASGKSLKKRAGSRSVMQCCGSRIPIFIKTSGIRNSGQRTVLFTMFGIRIHWIRSRAVLNPDSLNSMKISIIQNCQDNFWISWHCFILFTWAQVQKYNNNQLKAQAIVLPHYFLFIFAKKQDFGSLMRIRIQHFV